ncbi:MAG: hypothetical protein ACD_11C00005G0001 [uncultured bacterium]|nr:MAG: hypothetical protein ACD_11C00005G0001 [uncultured bacterium]HBR71712.1 hypothetical protein [Candidatus Moranbacteria bacterium]
MKTFRNSKNISKNILATITYYDVFSYPLTAFEIWKYLMRSDYYEEKMDENVALQQVFQELRQEPIIRFVEEHNGFYFLKGKKKLFEKRIGRTKISFSKLRRLRRVIDILKFAPFVKMIGITGRLAMKNAEHKSDWDVFVVLKSKHIWTGRTVMTALAHFIGKRRYGKKIQDRVCLNYFVTEDGMEISTKDLFSSNEYYFMYPMFGFEFFRKFQLKNRWIANIRPNYALSEIEPVDMVFDSFYSRNIRKIGEWLLDFQFLENWLGKIEKKKIMRNPKTRQEGGLIQATDQALVFLPELKGPRIFDEFKKKIESLS